MKKETSEPCPNTSKIDFKGTPSEDNEKFLDVTPNPLNHLNKMLEHMEDLSFNIACMLNQFGLFKKDFIEVYLKGGKI